MWPLAVWLEVLCEGWAGHRRGRLVDISLCGSLPSRSASAIDLQLPTASVCRLLQQPLMHVVHTASCTATKLERQVSPQASHSHRLPMHATQFQSTQATHAPLPVYTRTCVAYWRPKHLPALQTCCHPQIGQRSQNGAGGAAAGAAPKTMSAVLCDLVDRDRGEAQEAQRALLAACNGLAGLALLQGRTAAATQLYGRVLRHVRENAGVCDVDQLQHMHAVANLSAVPTPPTAELLPCFRQELQRRIRGSGCTVQR